MKKIALLFSGGVKSLLVYNLFKEVSKRGNFDFVPVFFNNPFQNVTEKKIRRLEKFFVNNSDNYIILNTDIALEEKILEIFNLEFRNEDEARKFFCINIRIWLVKKLMNMGFDGVAFGDILKTGCKLNKQDLKYIQHRSGFSGKVFYPLSAKQFRAQKIENELFIRKDEKNFVGSKDISKFSKNFRPIIYLKCNLLKSFSEILTKLNWLSRLSELNKGWLNYIGFDWKWKDKKLFCDNFLVGM